MDRFDTLSHECPRAVGVMLPVTASPKVMKIFRCDSISTVEHVRPSVRWSISSLDFAVSFKL